MGIELLLWGHPGGLAPSPTPAKTLLKKREQEANSKLILHFDEQFADWSLWVIDCAPALRRRKFELIVICSSRTTRK